MFEKVIMSKVRLILIGSIPHAGVDRTYGGATILMQSLVNYCERKKQPFRLIQANKYVGSNAELKNLFYVINTLLKINKRDFDIVMLNSSRNGAVFLAPIVFLICKCKRIKIIFRMFGGNFDLFFERIATFKQHILKHTILKSDIIYFETKNLLNYFSNLKYENLKWLPNVRSKRINRPKTHVFNKRFVFISQVMESKGIDVILKAASKLTKAYRVDIYGPIKDEKYKDYDFSAYNVTYQGVLTPEEVNETLLKYDVLLLPTHYDGEGYPGIIIEAFSIGMPVISTKWKSIPEIVNGNNGVLIETHNAMQLVTAIESFNQENYSSFSDEAAASFNNFDEERVYDNIFNDFEEILL